MEIFKFIQIFNGFNHTLKLFDNIFLAFDNKNKLKNNFKLNKNNINFFINLKIYTE